MRTDENYLRELELLDTFRQLGRQVNGQREVARPEAAKSVAREEPMAISRPPLQAAKTAAITPITIDPARIARIGAMDWEAVKTESAGCTACGLCKQRKQAVFGVGAESAPWLFVGEGPGAEEDELGEPFVGQAGKLLDAMLAAAGLQRGREV